MALPVPVEFPVLFELPFSTVTSVHACPESPPVSVAIPSMYHAPGAESSNVVLFSEETLVVISNEPFVWVAPQL